MPLSPRLQLPQPLTINQLIVLVALLFTLLYNKAFFHNIATLYGGSLHGIGFIFSLATVLFSLTVILLSCFCVRHLTKPFLAVLLPASAAASYFMVRYNVVLDTGMLTNALHTDQKEVYDLLSFELLWKLCALGILPSLVLLKLQVHCTSFWRELRNRLFLIAGAIVLTLISVVPFTADYSSFLREHKMLRYYANPITLIYSTVKLFDGAQAAAAFTIRKPLGVGAHIPVADHDRELIILVVGEAARADHFSLNGYTRSTNPLLAQEGVISFTQVTSCGTATAYSLPCMFSGKSHDDFDLKQASQHENLLDVLTHAKISVLWRDNNSDSKGVADFVEYQDFQSSTANPVCDIECRDVGMLQGLDQWIQMHPEGDLTIVLHQMGNHGPAYYKRYPQNFAKFQPICSTNELQECSSEAINNSYDNAILYTDYFLTKVIEFLKAYDTKFETAMLYVGDHGESLGENGLYLHGLPFMLAPESQKHVPALLWFGSHYAVDRKQVASVAEQPFSHDNFFHTVLGLMEVETPEYQASKDWLAGAHLSIPE